MTSPCWQCQYRDAEIARLRRIIADQDRDRLRALQERAAFVEEMTNQLERWREAQNTLIQSRTT